jgi:hypothetical protein
MANTLRARSPEIKKELSVSRQRSFDDRQLEGSADVELFNDCGFDAWAYVIYNSGGSTIFFRWPFVRNEDSLVLEDVADPTVYLYGVRRTASGGYDYGAWSSPNSSYCFSAGDCFLEVNVGTLQGNTRHNICGPDDNGPDDNIFQQPSPAPTERTGWQQDWIKEHNSRRTDFYQIFGMDPLDLKWSDSIAQSAQNYAESLIEVDGCYIAHGHSGDRYGGENLAANWGSGAYANARSPAEIMLAWYENEIDLKSMQLIGQKYHASQVIFRSSKYFGCGQAEKTMSDGSKCFIQACRYIASGNCFIEGFAQYASVAAALPSGCLESNPGSEWVCSVLSNSASEFCGGDLCPAEGCF